MPEVVEVKTGDRCPIDGGEFVVDEAQDPERVIDRNTRNTHSPAVAARFAERVREKADTFGVIHKCVTCGYRARFHPVDAGDPDEAPAGGEHEDGGDGDAAAGDADAGASHPRSANRSRRRK